MSDLSGKLASCNLGQENLTHLNKPLFFRLNVGTDREKFLEILKLPGIFLHDVIVDQIKELVRIKDPTIKYIGDELRLAALRHIGNKPHEEYGVWVFYPWSRRMVHIPDEEEFVEIRTSRNLYKITREERDILSKKKIGVIGLSVGQSVSLALVMERICGEIRIADFDTLELTNLNRIRSGIHNLGIHKTDNVAREIAEIDPFISVRCFADGAKEENLDAFLKEGGKLDLLIEESDGIDIKVQSRIKAREYRIPVIMEASDRCMVDIERFDLKPELGILHGLLDGLDLSTLKDLKTNEEKIPAMLAIAGLETASTRIKASMLEIEQTINTWPQLASAVAMGGGITADVCRRILLDQYTGSGRFHVDIEELIGNRKPEKEMDNFESLLQFTDVVSLTNNYTIKQEPGQVMLTEEEAKKIVSAAMSAPSGGNSQPWKWVLKQNTLLLFNAVDANPIFLGYGNIASYVALGASLENALLQARKMHYDCRVTEFPDSKVEQLIAQLSFFPEKNHDIRQSALAEGIFTRHTNRTIGTRSAVDKIKLDDLSLLVQEHPGAELRTFTSPDELDRIADLLGELEKLRLLEKDGQRDFAHEMRWTEEESLARRDGMDIRTLDVTNSEIAGLKIAQNKEVIDLIRQWNGGNAFKKLVRKSIDAAGAVCILSVEGRSPGSYLNGGRLLERLWIMANLKGLAFQPMSSSLYVYVRHMEGKGENISEAGNKKLRELRPHFEETFRLKPNQADILIFRLSDAKAPEVRSLRRPLEHVFVNIG